MAKNINILDRAPDLVISALNRLMVSFEVEDATGLDRPLWRDSSRYQGTQNFAVQRLNGVCGQAFRAGISWGYVDPRFAENWERSDGVIPYRTSYHVIYPDQPVDAQFANWIATHPQRVTIPRVIDLELQRDTHPRVIAQQTERMSNLCADYDGVRPLIYSRYALINAWLSPYWSATLLNEHYYWLAQYLWDRTREHPGPPTLPDGVERDRGVLHQTADKKATPTGEAESLSSDWDRWELGDLADMHAFIADTWDGAPPELPSHDEQHAILWEDYLERMGRA